MAGSLIRRMHCPECGHDDTRVIDSRPVEQGAAIRRRRVCASCESRFTTYERVVPVRMVRKRNGRLEAFDPVKLRRGVESALADRPVSRRAVDAFIASIEGEVLGSTGPTESDRIGRMVLEGLRELDEVAYLRFASVYREFQGASDFERALAELEDQVNLND